MIKIRIVRNVEGILLRFLELAVTPNKHKKKGIYKKLVIKKSYINYLYNIIYLITIIV